MPQQLGRPEVEIEQADGGRAAEAQDRQPGQDHEQAAPGQERRAQTAQALAKAVEVHGGLRSGDGLEIDQAFAAAAALAAALMRR